MATVAENPIIVDLTTTYGCMLVGCFLSCIMWGISSLQAFLYFSMYDTDSRRKKLLVAFLWVFDTGNQIVVLKSLWPVLIKNWGSVVGLSRILPELTHHAWIAQVLVFCVQMYFTHRIYIFSGKKKLFPICMIILSAFQLIILIPYDIITYAGGAKAENLATHTATSMVITLRAVTAFEDAALALYMIYLVLQNGLPEFHKTKLMAIRLLVVTVNTGAWTALVALVELILVAVYPSTLEFTILEFPLCSLYFSSFLASLNAREYVRGNTTTLTWNEAPSNVTGSNTPSGNTLYLGPMSRTGKSMESTPKGYGISITEQVHHSAV